MWPLVGIEGQRDEGLLVLPETVFLAVSTSRTSSSELQTTRMGPLMVSRASPATSSIEELK